MPTFTRFAGAFNLEFDSQQKRRVSIDAGGPLASNVAARLSFTSDDSGSYYNAMYFHQQSLYGVVLAELTPQYTVQFNSEFVDSRYRESDGVNRVNQGLLDNGTYLTGGPTAPISNFGTGFRCVIDAEIKR
jgi:iron complex outermembrane receptor protein